MRRNTKKILFVILMCIILAMGLETTGFSNRTVYAADASYVILSRYAATMDIGNQFYLVGITSTGKKPTFSSSKSSIASVDKYGLVTAKNDGKATIKVKSGKGVAYCFVVVNKTTIGLSKNRITLQKGQIIKLTANISSGSAPKFSSNKSSVARVDSSGNITAVKNGTAIVTVKADGESSKCTVVVNKPTITLDSYNISMNKGDNQMLTPKVSNGYSPKYSSSNSKVATVSTSGKITAVKKGKATITISEDGTKVKCVVNIT